jgi:tetratricopeptide (TPR) repeat protein
MPPIFDKLYKRTSPAATSASENVDGLYAEATRSIAAREFQRAIQSYDRAIALEPSRAESFYKRGNVLKDLGRFDAAITSYDQAIERKPDYAYAYCNRGFVQHRAGSLDAALASYDAAIALDASDALPHYNRALLMQDMFRWDDALASYDQAIAINPDLADAQYNRAVNLLFLGDFERGWRSYEWRWKNARRLGIGEVRDFKQPLWLGNEPLAGKRLLLHSEQGLGDTIQFCRFASLCAALGATVVLEAPRALLGLLENLDGVSELVSKGGPLPSFDYHCPLMSLPLAFGTTLDTVPAPAKYLRSDPAKVAQWHQMLGERARPRIGLTWSGNPNNPMDQRRSIRLADWVAHLPPEYQYFQLQTEVREADETALDSTPFLFSVDLQDFADTAAVCECMDLVVSVDTSLVHLSGALGLRTWALLAYAPDWRWMRDRTDSPWYPSLKLYRQKVAGGWHEVFTRLAADLRRELPVG